VALSQSEHTMSTDGTEIAPKQRNPIDHFFENIENPEYDHIHSSIVPDLEPRPRFKQLSKERNNEKSPRFQSIIDTDDIAKLEERYVGGDDRGVNFDDNVATSQEVVVLASLIGLPPRDAEDFVDDMESRESVSFTKNLFLLIWYKYNPEPDETREMLKEPGQPPLWFTKKEKSTQQSMKRDLHEIIETHDILTEAAIQNLKLRYQIQKFQVWDIFVWLYPDHDSVNHHVPHFTRCCLAVRRDDHRSMYVSYAPQKGHSVAAIKIKSVNQILEFLEKAESTFQSHFKYLQPQIHDLNDEVRTDLIINRCCCIKSYHWPLPRHIHAFIDTLYKIEEDLYQLDDHVDGLALLLKKLRQIVIDAKEKKSTPEDSGSYGSGLDASDKLLMKLVEMIKESREEEEENDLFFKSRYRWLVENWDLNYEKQNNNKATLRKEIIDNPTFLDKKRDLLKHILDLEKSLEVLVFKMDTKKRLLLVIKEILQEKLDLEQLFDQNKLTAIGTIIGIPAVISGLMGMNCVVPVMAGAGPDDPFPTFWWILVSTLCAISFSLFLYTMIGSANSRFDWHNVISGREEDNKSRKSLGAGMRHISADKINSLYNLKSFENEDSSTDAPSKSFLEASGTLSTHKLMHIP